MGKITPKELMELVIDQQALEIFETALSPIVFNPAFNTAMVKVVISMWKLAFDVGLEDPALGNAISNLIDDYSKEALFEGQDTTELLESNRMLVNTLRKNRDERPRIIAEAIERGIVVRDDD